MAKTSILKLVALGLGLFAIAIVIFTDNRGVRVVLSNSSGSSVPLSVTGAPSESTCLGGCHTLGPLGGESLAIEVRDSTGTQIVSGYQPGLNYKINVTHTSTGTGWGFEITALDSTPARAGDMSAADSTTLSDRFNNSREYTNHSSPNTGNWTFNWTAPSTNVGTVTFYAAGVRITGNGFSNDRVYTTSKTLPVNNYTIAVSAAPSGGGTVSGGGTFAAGSSRTVTATANAGYSFTNWTENGGVVSTFASYTFTLNGNRNLVANFSVGSNGASYDPTLKAPKCAVAGNVCDSGVLLNGRDTITNGPEPNQPNTINNSCPDGTLGTYHVDESIDAIKVSTLDASNLAAGKTVKIEVTIWAYTDYPSDHLDLYYAADAGNPNWIYLNTVEPSTAGAQVLSTTYTLPNGASLQAVRARFRYVGAPSSCAGAGSSSFDDYDDLIFAVQPSPLLINTVTPAAGRSSGGQQIVLAGAFAGLSTVSMGGASASWFYTNGSGDTSSITVTTPAHAAGAVQIDLTPTAGSPYSKANAFAYLPTVFTDDTLFAGVTIAKAQHIIELRQAVDAMRAVAGLAPAPWADPTLSPTSTIIKAVHIMELRTYLNNAASLLGYATSPYTDPSLTTGFVIHRIHIEELRQRIRTIAG